MADAHPFILLCLPLLALETVIKQMAIKIQLDISTLSKRSQWAVRTSTLKQKVCLEFYSFKSISAEIKHSKSTAQGHTIELERSSEHPTFADMSALLSKIASIFKNLGVTLSINHVSKDRLVFETRTAPALSTDDYDRYRSMFELVPIIKQLNITLDFVNVTSEQLSDDLCNQALAAAKDTKKLRIHCKTSPNFQPSELGTFDLEHLDIKFASWFTRDHLFNNFPNCTVIELQGSRMTIHDLNDIFKNWVQGSSMKSFRWVPNPTDNDWLSLDTVLVGIPCVAVKKATIKQQKQEFRDNSCFMIEQVGGAKAIVWKGRFYPVCMETEFSLD